MRAVKDNLATPLLNDEGVNGKTRSAADLLCSRNARPEKGRFEVAGIVSLLAERTPSEGPRSTCAVRDHSRPPWSEEKRAGVDGLFSSSYGDR